MNLILGATIGGLVAFIFSIPAILLEIMQRGKVKNIPLLVDVKTIFGRKLTKNEVFWITLLLFIINGIVFGFVYVWLVEQGWLSLTQTAFSFISIIFYALFVWIILGAIIFPILKMGLFGKKEGNLVWLELLVSQVLIAIGVWFAIHYYQPIYF